MPDIQFHALGAVRARSGDDPLIAFLHTARNADVTISARDVRRLDSHRLQILLVAQKQWLSEGYRFTVMDKAPTFYDGLERLGIPSDQFDEDPVS
ncbi:STAS domain-containing protein [Cognatishimia sp. F0-27]|uniref:STAS domain-containing protein n=1 Tax=Cognatishimia sp. F0-27 TaxID=2816855 RepID=UPI001D0CBC93|nr:STAS domain-containing protein [Cognatishimia sp. F0-27]MCC1492059.1 hypothetical protein [Cognatishimia sp. F0-27]